jgi:hypothetical protein
MLHKETIMQTLKCMPNQYPHLLEQKFPHVLKKILDLWHTPHCEAYFADLLQPNGRGGGRMDRDGFPPKAWEEIFNLSQHYKKLRPKLAAR